jgi:D-arabinose 1-dehydrogenase-like Zn-dependent alcohol dehydrogenase
MGNPLPRTENLRILAFAAEGKVKATIETLPLDSINDVFERMKKGKVNGRVVFGIGEAVGSESLQPVLAGVGN